MSGAIRVSMDIGGTFTDAVAYDETTGQYRAGKASTTPGELNVGVRNAMRTVADSPSDLSFCVHGTTQGLNAFLERRGERVLLVASQGAGDVYQIARGHRTRLYDIQYSKPEPLLSRRDTIEVGGRFAANGEELEAISADDIERIVTKFSDGGYTSIAVALLFAHDYPDHEIAVHDQLKQRLGDDVPVSLSHRLAREWREYERTSTTVLDAYTAPIVRTYLTDLASSLKDDGMAVPLHIMQSNGGIITAASAQHHTVQTLLSGPVGGAMGGASLARLTGIKNLICVDMGGTSFDVSLIIDGEPDVSTEADLEGFPLLMPVVNIYTIGAGGGSVAYEEAGGLRVGPRSAGARPGPACYGRGGTEPTVTDANVGLGRVDPGAFAGGEFALDVEAAQAALADLGARLGLSAADMAEGILDVVNAKMAQAIRTLTVEKGIEPRDFALVAFGGAGPMHAAFLADELGIETMIVPRFPGAFSAWGMLETQLRHDTARGYPTALADADLNELQAVFGEMIDDVTAAMLDEGVDRSVVSTQLAIDTRYVGQEYTLTIPIGSLEDIGAEGFATDIKRLFDVEHLNRFGHCNPDAPIEFVVARSTSLGDLGRAEPEALQQPESMSETITSDVQFDGAIHATPIVQRDSLAPGSTFDGPAVVVETTSTTVIPPRWNVELDKYGTIIAHRPN